MHHVCNHDCAHVHHKILSMVNEEMTDTQWNDDDINGPRGYKSSAITYSTGLIWLKFHFYSFWLNYGNSFYGFSVQKIKRENSLWFGS